jgi:hypothetical protein
MFAPALADLPDHLPDVDAAPGAWSDLPEWVRTPLIAEGEAALATPFPMLHLDDWLAFSRSGDRVGYETPYFARRRQLNALVLAECVEAKGRFLKRIAEGIWLICEESGWQLPAHNSLVRGGPRLPLPNPDQPVIDLFAAETAAQLAVAAQLLGPALEQTVPDLIARIDRELETRLFRPYLTRHFWWMGDGDEKMNNWTAWCTQNVLIAAFARPTPQPFRRAVVAQAAASLDAFLKDYGDDGACEEGVLYYRHAGLCLCIAMLVLDRATGGRLAPIWREPKLRNTAEYIVHMHVDGPRYFNFADSSALVERCGAREYLFGKAVGSALLADFAAADWATERRATLPDEINLFYRVQAAFAAPELAAHPTRAISKPDIFLPSIGLLAARDENFALAVKAGDNGDGHNHNDVGSVIVYKHGRPVLIDIGVETYTKQTFSTERYSIWTMQSAFHNLPTFGTVMQSAGEDFAAREVVTHIAPDTAEISMEIAGAYPPEARLRAYRRAVRLNKGHAVTIADHFDGDLPATLSLLFAERPNLEPGRISLPGLATLTLTGAGPLTLGAIPITDPRLRRAWPDTLYRVLVPLAGPDLDIIIT